MSVVLYRKDNGLCINRLNQAINYYLLAFDKSKNLSKMINLATVKSSTNILIPAELLYYVGKQKSKNIVFDKQ